MTELTPALLDALRQQIRLVALARQSYHAATNTLTLARVAWERENAFLIDTCNAAATNMETAENTLREMTLAAYGVTGDKAPVPGVNIRLVTRLVYEDRAAVSWAQEHHMALQLDRKAFETIARAQPLPCVEYRQEVQATIATELRIEEETK